MSARRETTRGATTRRERGTHALAALSLAFVLGSCGNEIEYYPTGARRAEGRLAIRSEHSSPRSGEREEGAWTFWYPNGERRESGTYKDGKRSGEWTQWYPNGQRRSRGNRVFDATTHSSPREGLWTFWHENGEILARGLFVHGRREGHWDFSRVDGSIDAEKTGEYHQDIRID